MQLEVAMLPTSYKDEFFKKFERELLLVSHISSNTISFGALLLDNRATCHMTGARYFFDIFTESNLDVHVELGMGTKPAVKGFGT
jgi:hypothetical protein